MVIIFAVLQFFALKFFHQEIITRLPDNLFTAVQKIPLKEITLSFVDERTEETERRIQESSQPEEEAAAEPAEEEQQEPGTGIEEIGLSDIQRSIVLRSLEILEESRVYEYELYPETGYPEENVAISTDVISIILRDCGYDLMELIYEDMEEHPDAYPMDIIGRDEPIKYIDFRHVFFQQTFFDRHALQLGNEYEPQHENNNIQWQPGDVVYFQFDPDNPHQNLGGIISSNTNDQGVPLVIMTSKELGQVSEVDVLADYEIIGHYRYPYPEEMQ
ncbi:MAG: DUF1287 domain-containing protein [Actinomycetota bacterium]